MKVISLQSGSNGNCFYVETPTTRLLFDAGISARQAQLRLAQHGRDINDVDALLISHDHSDHAKGMGVFQRKFGFPVYLTRRTLAASQRFLGSRSMNRVRFFAAGSTIAFRDVAVHTIPTPHDSAEGVAFVVEHAGQRVGILTDLGHAFDGLRDVLRSLDAVIIESNYDDGMLEHGRYPQQLKKRIRGNGGHLSNEDAAQLLRNTVDETKDNFRLQWACLCHLSEDNNTPDVARETHQKLLGDLVEIHVASRYDVSDVMEVK
ncbi:MBL fold metallo-hydrolase [Mariniblastus fucicola]|uniref:Metallo-hydrolase YycJ n=1 Tax=Mariniblastus fucicola TaxID=980251 RepID=A0A5B9P5J8_9BACT|nr:MBL fold metallo-hydrolase [Mariniblastus fucicola]QEG20252.1 Putative metallo-hydrolase YycJ [Mariniblastus fucicola]